MKRWKEKQLKKKIRQDGPTLGEEAAGVAGGPCARLLSIQLRFHKGTVK
jgi:hypothetical protein